MDIRIEVSFKFEESLYPADILILKLSAYPIKFFYVVHIFDDQLVSQFSARYILASKECNFMPVKTQTQRETMLIQSMQSAIMNHKYHPCLYNKSIAV